MSRPLRRVVFFFLCMLAGLAIGLTYGWVINPIQFTDSSLHTLRIDYRTDLILMAAELYQEEGNIDQALTRLEPLGEAPLPEMLEQTIAFAEEHQYESVDLQLMENLASAVETTLIPPE